MRTLRGRDSRLACAAALIRVNDWVPQVSEAALECIAALVKGDGARHLFGLLGLILEQKDRHRFASRLSWIEPVLLEPQWHSERAIAMNEPDPFVRRYAFEIALRSGANSIDLLLRGAADPAATVANWSLEKAAQALSGDELQRVLHTGMASRISDVRATALRQLLGARINGIEDWVNSALFDRARSVRNTAAWFLKNRGDSALPIWRAAFDADTHLATTTSALSEHGDPGDIERLRHGFSGPNVRIRADALRGLHRLRAADCAELLTQALCGRSSFMARTALDLYQKGNDAPTRSMLEKALDDATSLSLRKRLIGASRLLGKWEGLAFLLYRHLCDDERDIAAVDTALRRWARDYNRSFTTATPSQRDEITRSLALLRSSKPSALIAQIKSLAK